MFNVSGPCELLFLLCFITLLDLSCGEKTREFNGTSTHLLKGYISANQRFFSTFLSKITEYNRVNLGFNPVVARLLGRGPTPRPTCPVSCGECDVIPLYFMCFSVNVSVCLLCCMFDSVCELFGETIRNMFGCGCYFVVECYGFRIYS